MRCLLAIGSGVVAILYGLCSVRWILAQPAGNARMQEIAAAIQAGAQAYLNRQYTTIAIVGVGPVRGPRLALGWPPPAASRSARCSPVSPATSACTSRCAPTCAPRRPPCRHQAALKVAFRGGAITGMLVVGLGLLGVAGYYLADVARCWATPERRCARWSASPSAAR